VGNAKSTITTIFLIILFSFASSFITYVGVRNYYENANVEIRYVPVIVYRNRTKIIYTEESFTVVELISENTTIFFYDSDSELTINILFAAGIEGRFYFNLTVANETMWFKMYPANISLVFSGTIEIERSNATFTAPFADKRVLMYSFGIRGESIFTVLVKNVKRIE